jgi:hypothetical protein
MILADWIQIAEEHPENTDYLTRVLRETRLKLRLYHLVRKDFDYQLSRQN